VGRRKAEEVVFRHTLRPHLVPGDWFGSTTGYQSCPRLIIRDL